MKLPKNNALLNGAMLEAVETQLSNNDPPETRQTLDRLLAWGFTEKDAKQLIASAIFAESVEVLKYQTPFNHDRFVRFLNQLPKQKFK
jgi:hypothetical protein